MKYKVKEIIEVDREGNKKIDVTMHNTYNQAVFYIKQRMKDIIKQDTIKFLRKHNQEITTEKLNSYCEKDLSFWLEEADEEQFTYVAGYLGWGCFWMIEEDDKV